MARRAAGTNDPDLKAAYNEIVSIWSSNGHH
jgi:hypothetical protein